MLKRLLVILVPATLTFGLGCVGGLRLPDPIRPTAPPPATSPEPAPSSSSRVLTMPDVRGLTAAAATQRLRAAGFTGSIEIAKPSELRPGRGYFHCGWDSNSIPNEYEEGSVCHQMPYPGRKTGSRLMVQLETVERTTDQFLPMPNVVGLTLDAARARLAKEGMRVLVRVSTDSNCKLNIHVAGENGTTSRGRFENANEGDSRRMCVGLRDWCGRHRCR